MLDALKSFYHHRVGSLAAKMAIPIAALMIFVSLNIYFIVPDVMHGRSLDMTREKAASIATMTAYAARAALDFGLHDQIQEAIETALQNEDVAYIVVVDADGEIVDAFNQALADRVGFRTANERHELEEEEIYQIRKPIAVDDRDVGALYLGLSLAGVYRDIENFQTTMIFIALGFSVIGVLAAIGIGRATTAPMREMSKTFGQIADGDLTKRVDVERSDEVGLMARSFNVMVESLELAYNSLEDFNSQLKTEIADRERAEAELRKLTQAIVQSPVSIMLTNVDLTIEYVNPKYLQATGFREEEIVGTKSDFLAKAKEDPEAFNGLGKTLAAGDEWKGEFLNRDKEGNEYWEIASISPITDERGVVTHYVTVKENITEQKALEESGRKYDFIVNSSREFMALVNREYRFEAVNESFCRALDREREELLGSTLSRAFTEKRFSEEMKSSVDACFEGGELSLELGIVLPGFDEERTVHFRLYPYYDEHRRITHVVSVGADVTEERRTARVLKESEERYKGLVSELPDMVIVHQGGKVVFANQVIEEVTGFSPEEGATRDIFSMVKEEDRPRVVEQIERRLAGEDVKSFEIEIVKKDGSLLPVEVRGAVIAYGGRPAILNVIVNIEDRKKFEEKLKRVNEELERGIAERTSELSQAVELLQKEIEERKQFEESLRDSEEKFKALAEYSNDVIMRFDRDFKILYANRASEAIMDVPADEFVGKTMTEIGFADSIVKVWSGALEKVFDRGVERRVEFQTTEGVWIDLIISPEFSKEERVKTALASARDITQLKENERALIAAKEKALEASRLKSEFLANMSHEIRTPMNAILGFTALINASLEDRKQKSRLDAIKTAGKNLLTLINDILDLSKIEAGKFELNYEPVDPRALIEEVRQIFTARIAEKNLEFDVWVDPELPEGLLLDEVRLRQALFNLIGNAVKFTDEGGVKLRVENVYKAEDRSKVDLLFTVEDTGVGIPKESQKEIFESFKQQEGQSARKYGGTGLGLAITKRLVEMMGGDISVESEPGVGSAFLMRLRDVAAASIQRSALKEAEERFDRIVFDEATVLVVDDIKTNRDLIVEFFATTAVTTVTAENGAEAIEAAKASKPDAILMDIRMPVMDGYEATRRIRAIPELDQTPIVAVTASAMKGDEDKILGSGFDDYLVKPVQLEGLIGTLKKYLSYVETEAAEDAREAAETSERREIPPKAANDALELFDDELFALHEKAAKNHFLRTSPISAIG